MNKKELINYTKNIDSYSEDDIFCLEIMSDEEIERYQYDLEYETGNNTNWDSVRCLITLKIKIKELEDKVLEMDLQKKILNSYYELEKQKFKNEVTEKKQIEIKLEKLNNKFNKLDLSYIEYIKNNYTELMFENANLLEFKECAMEILKKHQILKIKEKIENKKDF